MRLNFTSISFGLALATLVGVNANARNDKGFELTSQNEVSTTVNFQNPEFLQVPVDVNGSTMYNIVTIEGAVNLEAGMPDVPHYTQAIAVPFEGKMMLEVTGGTYYDIQNVDIAPSKGNLYRNVLPSSVPFEFGSVYQEDAFYPGVLAETRDPFIMRNQRGQTIVTYPFQYNPVTKTLRVYKEINVTVINNANETGINELTVTGKRTSQFESIYAHQFLNYQAFNNQRYTPLEEDGSMLIIGPASLQDGMEQIALWKNQRGIRTEWVDVATIGNTDTQILAYIQDYYNNNPELVYVLLVGDHAQVNSHTYGSSGWEQLWSDSYYGQLSGSDFYPEVFVGRYSATSSTQLQTMIDRSMEYERTPVAGDHYKKAIGLGSDEGAGIGDEGEADWQHLRNIRTELMNYGMTTVYEFYDGSHGGADANGNPSSTEISAAVNDGITLFNYTGHGDQNTCITGNFGSSHINAASNNGKYPFVISVACNNGTFTSGTCISETWQRAKNASGPTGAIAACGSSILMSWAPPMETQDEMSKILTEQYASNTKTSLGGLFYNSQMSTVQNHGSAGVEVMQTWVFFGDPSVTFRSDDPRDMSVNHYSWVEMGTDFLNVNCDTDGALVTVSQSGNILGSTQASGGFAQFNFDALTSDDYLVVVATKYNYRPYMGFVQVGSGPAGISEDAFGNLSVYPNPAEDIAIVQFDLGESSDVLITLTDISGKVVKTVVNGELSAGQQQIEVTTADVESGVYLVTIQVNDQKTVQKLTVK